MRITLLLTAILLYFVGCTSDQSDGDLNFSPPILNLGRVPPGGKVKREVQISATKTVKIESVTASCGCTKPELSSNIAGSQGIIMTVSFDAPELIGPFEHQIAVLTQDGPSLYKVVGQSGWPVVANCDVLKLENRVDGEPTLIRFSSIDQSPFEIVRVESVHPSVKVSYRAKEAESCEYEARVVADVLDQSVPDVLFYTNNSERPIIRIPVKFFSRKAMIQPSHFVSRISENNRSVEIEFDVISDCAAPPQLSWFRPESEEMSQIVDFSVEATPSGKRVRCQLPVISPLDRVESNQILARFEDGSVIPIRVLCLPE